MSQHFLLEIGTEEIPAGYVDPALRALSALAREGFGKLRLHHGRIRLWGTPRRLALMVEQVGEVQEDLDTQIVGPPKGVAFDESGAPTAAAAGFAKAHGVSVDELEVVETQRGPYVGIRKRQPGRAAREVLASEVPRWITGIPFPKSMRWKDLDIRFARPIHWIVALFGEEIIPFSLGPLQSGRATFGHRFMKPVRCDVPSPEAYVGICRDLCVIADPAERKQMIARGAREAAGGLSGRLVEDEELLEIVVQLVEYPVALTGGFDPEFLSLPRDVLVTTMREQQKFFCVEDDRGELMPYFVNIANLKTGSMDLIRKGNERVLRARLSDARFFFQEDVKQGLEERVDRLRGVIFHNRIGTLYEKVMRVQRLARTLAERLAPELAEKVSRAAYLCKADLTTEMVGEFPSLQGIMGREYALLGGEDTEVSVALAEHYLPAFSGDRLPSTEVGALVAIADKMDTILGCFAVGEIPTGAGDPFGLRRAALGILNVMLERGYEAELGWIVDRGLELIREALDPDVETVRADVLEFFRVRLGNLWSSQGRPAEAVEAILSSGFENLPDALSRLNALEAFMKEDGFEDLAVAFKRVLNIIGDTTAGNVDAGLFEHPEEERLLEQVSIAERDVATRLKAGDPLGAMRVMAALRPVIDAFFDAVLVNVEDQKIRRNRLHMLARLGGLFLRLADYSKITTRP